LKNKERKRLVFKQLMLTWHYSGVIDIKSLYGMLDISKVFLRTCMQNNNSQQTAPLIFTALTPPDIAEEEITAEEIQKQISLEKIHVFSRMHNSF